MNNGNHNTGASQRKTLPGDSEAMRFLAEFAEMPGTFGYLYRSDALSQNALSLVFKRVGDTVVVFEQIAPQAFQVYVLNAGASFGMADHGAVTVDMQASFEVARSDFGSDAAWPWLAGTLRRQFLDSRIADKMALARTAMRLPSAT